MRGLQGWRLETPHSYKRSSPPRPWTLQGTCRELAPILCTSTKPHRISCRSVANTARVHIEAASFPNWATPFAWEQDYVKGLLVGRIPGILCIFRKCSYRNYSNSTLVSSPDQIFRVRPADSSKNRVWTLSLRKLGQVYIWRAVNWVIVGVNYIISNWQRLLWGQKICKLAIYDDA